MAQLTMAFGANDTIKFLGLVAGGGDCGCFCTAYTIYLIAKKELDQRVALWARVWPGKL